jgi:protein-disulfide isomerase
MVQRCNLLNYRVAPAVFGGFTSSSLSVDPETPDHGIFHNEVIMTYKHIAVIVLMAALCFSTQRALAAPDKNPPSKIDWQVEGEWKLPATPMDIVYSLDQKHVFVLTDQHQVLIYDNTGKIEGTIPVSPGIKAIDIAPRGENLYLIDADKKTLTSVAVDFVIDINTAGSPSRGNKDAPVTIVEFSDFECPYCKQAAPLLDQVLKNNPDTVKLVFKNMPLRVHRYAELAARAATAAQHQGKFWEFYHALFSSQKLNPQIIEAIAGKLKLNMQQYKKDLSSQKTEQRIIRDIRDADAAGVTGTPAIFINGRALRNRSPDVIQKLINEEVRKVKSAH